MNRVLKDNRMRSFILRNEKIVAIFIIILSIAIVLPRAHLIKIFLEIKRIDFYYYWIMARMFLSNSNPYNQDLFFSTLQIFDPGQGNSVMPYYPPWILPILTPLGLLPYSIGHLVWFGISLYLLFYIILHAWNYYRGKPSKRWVALLIIIIYYPIIFALYQGQATILVFIGLAGFIFAMIKGKDYIAGIFLILLTVKPHIVYLVLFSILVIVLLKRILQNIVE
ncbi:MAG: glycosyltransferase family 87 protein [bacterium]